MSRVEAEIAFSTAPGVEGGGVSSWMYFPFAFVERQQVKASDMGLTALRFISIEKAPIVRYGVFLRPMGERRLKSRVIANIFSRHRLVSGVVKGGHAAASKQKRKIKRKDRDRFHTVTAVVVLFVSL